LDTDEAEAILRSADQLPLLPAVLETVESPGPRGRAILSRARELWDAGSGIGAQSLIRRRLAVGYALPVLLEDVPPEHWNGAREQIEAWVVQVDGMLAHLYLPRVESSLRAAQAHLARADGAASDRSRVYYLMMAGAELVETTPRYVARDLTAEAEAAVDRAKDQALHGPETLKRAERLKNWASRAVEEGDYLRAIQRAYYALQLVEGE
jgi:hypothetical protein